LKKRRIKVNKDLKKFILFLIGSIIVAFAISYSYSAYQSHEKGKDIDKVKTTFNFENTDKKVEDVKEESGDPQEVWQEQRLGALESLGYAKVDIRPFYKRIYDKLTGKKVYNYIDKSGHETEAGSFEFCNEVLYENLNIKNETVIVEVKDNKIIEKFFDGDKELIQIELTANDDYSSYDQKIYSYITKKTITVKDVLNKDTYLNTKNGIIEYEDGKTIEFTHKNSEMNGPAIETFPNGDKIEFNFVNDKRIGEAEKFYKNGDREIFTYGKNNKKNARSLNTTSAFIFLYISSKRKSTKFSLN